MKIKLDENLPRSLSAILRKIGFSADTVFDENLQGVSDKVLWQTVKSENRFLITQDLDFSNEKKFKAGTHAGIILLRLKNPGRNALINKVTEIFQSGLVKQWKRCFVVVTDSKIRVRYPVK